MSVELIDAVWDTVLALGAAGLAHGDLHAGAFRVDRGQVLIDNLSRASVATDQDRHNIDLAQLLTLSALAVGTDEAVAIADRRLGAQDLASIVPYLQKAALGPALRRAASNARFNVDDLRARAAATAEIEAPKMASIRRVSTRTLVQAGLLAAAAYFLISTLAGVDINQVLDALRTASLPTLLLALIVGQLPAVRLCRVDESGLSPTPSLWAAGAAAVLRYLYQPGVPGHRGTHGFKREVFPAPGDPTRFCGFDRVDRERGRLRRADIHNCSGARFRLR